jgi:hypothetical protein
VSVHFTIDAESTGAFIARCPEGTVYEADSYPLILEVIVNHRESCDVCACYGMYSQPVMDATVDGELQLSNLHAHEALALLGLANTDGEPECGSVNAATLLELVDSVIDAPDADRPAKIAPHIWAALASLGDLAWECGQQNRNVVWG